METGGSETAQKTLLKLEPCKTLVTYSSTDYCLLNKTLMTFVIYTVIDHSQAASTILTEFPVVKV